GDLEERSVAVREAKPRQAATVPHVCDLISQQQRDPARNVVFDVWAPGRTEKRMHDPGAYPLRKMMKQYGCIGVKSAAQAKPDTGNGVANSLPERAVGPRRRVKVYRVRASHNADLGA